MHIALCVSLCITTLVEHIYTLAHTIQLMHLVVVITIFRAFIELTMIIEALINDHIWDASGCMQG